MIELDSSKHGWSPYHKIIRATWNCAWYSLGYWGPRSLSPWRVFLLKIFGAKIGNSTLICSRVKILMPWNLELGNCVAVSERVDIYNFGRITVGDNTCISQGVWLCTGTHDYSLKNFPLIWDTISIGSSVWLAAEAFVHPGVVIENGVVVGARSVVTNDLPGWGVYAGNPCVFIKKRNMKS